MESELQVPGAGRFVAVLVLPALVRLAHGDTPIRVTGVCKNAAYAPTGSTCRPGLPAA